MSLSDYSESDFITSNDSDGDSLTDITEFALGLNPQVPDKTFLAPENIVTPDGQRLTRWKYVEMRNRTEVQVVLEFSTDLLHWTAVNDGFFISRETAHSRLRVIESPTRNLHGFWRVKIQSRSAEQ
jgi:hypothetical protein